MKGRYLIVAAVLLLSLSLLFLPADHDESSATTQLTPGDLTSTMELTDSFQSFTVGGNEILIKASGPDTQGPPATIGLYNSAVYLVADSYPENYPSGDSNEITIQWTRNNQTEERTFAVTNLGADKSTSVFMLAYSGGIQVTLSYGGVSIPSTFGDWFYAETTEERVSQSKGFRTDSGCILDVTNMKIKGSIIDGHYRFSVDDASTFTLSNNVASFDLTYPLTITSRDDPDKTVTLTCTAGTGSNFQLSNNTMTSMILTNAMDNECSMTGVFGDGSSVTYSNYRAATLMMAFDAGDPSVIYPYQGTAASFHREQGSPVIRIGGNEFGFTDSGDFSIRYENDGSETLLSGAVSFSGCFVKTNEMFIGLSDSGNISVSNTGSSVTVDAEAGSQFAMGTQFQNGSLTDGRVYTAQGSGTVSYNALSTDDASLAGVFLNTGQSIILGNGALAYLGDLQGAADWAVRNDSSITGTACGLTVDNSADPPTISTGDSGLVFGIYRVSQNGLQPNVSATVTGVPFSATVSGGTVNKTAGSYSTNIVVAAGDTYNALDGSQYTAVTDSVFTEIDSVTVMISGSVSVSSQQPVTLRVMAPDGTFIDITGATAVTVGDTVGFEASTDYPDISIVAGSEERSYTVLPFTGNTGQITTAEFTVTSDLTVTLLSGSVRFSEDSPIIANGVPLTVPASATASVVFYEDALTLVSGTVQFPQGESIRVLDFELSASSDSVIMMDEHPYLLSGKIRLESANAYILVGDLTISGGYPYIERAAGEDAFVITTAGAGGEIDLSVNSTSVWSATANSAITLNAEKVSGTWAFDLAVGSVRATSYTLNGLYMEGVNGEDFIVSSNGRVSKTASYHLYFNHDNTKQYTFSSNASFSVTDDGKPVILQNFVTLPQDGTFYFNTENGPCCVTAVSGSGMAVNGTNTDKITGIEKDEVVQVTGEGVSFYITGADQYNTASVDVNWDGTLTISGGTSKEAILELQNMTLHAGTTTFVGSGTLDVLSTMNAVTTTYTSGAFAVSGSLIIAGFTVSGDYSVSGTSPDVTVPASGTVTFTPVDGGESSVYENASSVSEMVFSNTTGVFRITSGAYKLHAGGTVTIGGYDVTFVSQDEDAFAAVGAGSITASNAQKFNFVTTDSGDTYTFTAAADGTVFSISTGIEVTAGAVAIGGENYEQVTIRTQAGPTWYESSTGAVISVGDEWGELVSGTALVDDGSRLVVSGIDYLAGDGGATITLSGTDAVLTDGCIVLEDGYHIKAGEVTVTNSSGPDISLYSTMTAEMAQGSTISTEYGSQTYTYTAVSATTVNIAADGRISVNSGNITLNQNESVTVGDVTLTATVDSTTLYVADGVATLQTGAVILSASGTIILRGTSVTGPVSASVSDTPTLMLTVTVAGGGTVSFTTTTTTTTIYRYTNASDSVPLVLAANSEGGTFSPQSGSYYVYYGSPVSVNGVTVSVGGQEGDHITVDAGSSTVTMANGQKVTFSTLSYTAASDGTSFIVNSQNDLRLNSGSVTLSEGQRLRIGSTTYTAGSNQTVISSVDGTAVLTSGSVSVPAGSSLTVGSAAYTAVNGPAIISVTNGIATLESGTVTLEGGASVNIGGVTVLNNGTVPFDVPTNGEITLPQGAKIRATLGSTSNDFIVASQTEVRVESDGTISIISTDSLSLAQGESVTIGNTVITADTASEISVGEEVATLVSGTVSLNTVSAGNTPVKIGLTEISGASSASVGTSTYVVGPAGGTLSINSETYQNASQTQTIKFTYDSGAFVLSEGSYLTTISGDGFVTVNGFKVYSGSDTGDSLELTIGTDTVAVNGTVPIRIVKNDMAWTYGSPTNAVFTFGANAVLTSGSVAVPDAITLMIGDAGYTADGGDTVLSVENGKAVLDSGSVIVPANASVTVLGTEFTAFNGSGAISLVTSPSGDYAEIYQDSLSIVSADSLTVSLSQSGSLLKVGDSTYAYSGSTFSLGIAGTDVTMLSTEPWVTFNGAIIIGGVTYRSDGEASLCYNGTLCELGSGMISFAGTSASPVSLRIMTYSVSTDSAVKIGLEETQTEEVITLHSGSVTAASDIPLTVNGTAFDVGSGVTVTASQAFTIPEQRSISFTVSATEITITGNGPEDLTYTHADSLLAIPAGCEVQLTISSAATVTYGIVAVSDATVAVGTDVQELKSGSVELPRAQSVKIGSGLYSMEEESVLGIESGTAVLLEGAVSVQESAALKVGGTLFTAGSDGASITYSDQSVPRIRAGSVTASGTFAISSEVVSYFFDGSGTYTVAVNPTDKSVNLTTSGDGTAGTMIKITSGQEFMVLQEVSSATLNVKDVSATGAAPPTAKLLAGSAVLGENASVTVPAHGDGADRYILFYGGTPGEVRVEHQSLNSPIVTLKSGSISLDDGVDPTYTNTGSGEASFVALGSNELSLKEGAITVPEGSTVWVGEKSITNTSGSVSVDSSGNITLGAQSHALIRDEFGGEYYLDNDGSEPMTQNVDQYVESHAFTGFNERREVCISSVQEMYRTGQSQKVRALIDSTVEKLRSAVYDSSISYEENLRMLDHMVRGLEGQIRDMFDPEQAFQDYKESIKEELAALHLGETSLSEQRIIDYAIENISNMQYSEQTYDDDMAAITEALAVVEKNLSGYRSSGSAAFVVLREILKDYVKTEPVDDFEAIASLKQQYTSALEDIQYLNNLSSDANLQRLNDLRDAFDGAVYSIHSTEYQKKKNTVLAEMNALYQSYPSPTAGELIDSAIAKVNLRTYDAQRVYKSNVDVLNDLLYNLKANLGSTLLGNIETFNTYCDKFLKRYTEAIASYTQAREASDDPDEQVLIDDILGWIQEAKDKVDPTVEGHITYDTTKSLNDNINAVFAIAKDLEDDINNHINAQISNELDRVYDAARAHLNLNDREGVPTKLRDYIATTRTNLETEYNSEHSAMDKGLNINVIMTTYNTEMAVLIEQAEFYLNVDVGVKYLQDRYATSYAAVVSLMNTDIALLRALEYDTSKEMSQNLSELQERINSYSVALATLRKNTTQGDFENYREFRAWTVTEYLSDTSTQAEKDLANQYAASIRAVVFNGKSIESNRYAVDRLFSEFEGKYLALMADQRKGDFDALRNTLKSNIDAALLDEDGDSVRAAAERGKTWIGEFVFDRSADYDTNSANITLIRDATLLAIEYERSTDAAVKAAKVAQANSNILNLPGLIAAINAQSAVDDSQKIRTIIENARAAVSGISYDFSQSPRDNLASAEAVMARFSQDLYEQRLMENSTTVGGIRADGKTIDGKTAEYPKDSDEIWGIVANATGLGDDASATISRVTPTLDPAAGTMFPAAGSVANVLSNGKVLGAFDVTLYNGGERVTSFSGMYFIKILLPEDMRGFDSVQVAYVDEFGDVQIYDARVEGNYLVFETVHFSTFNVYGNIILHTHYDIYLYVVLIVLAVLLLVFLIRVVRYDANGGQGSTPATVFFCDGEGSLPENGFTREGYTFGGWSRKADGSDPISADAELSALGKIHFLKLYAVWNKEEVQQ